MKPFMNSLILRLLNYLFLFSLLGYLGMTPVLAQDQLANSPQEIGPLHNPLNYAYGGKEGSSFFMLTDTTYGSTEESFVRVEVSDLSAVADYGGVDIRLYQVPRPLEFLAQQKNLHQVEMKAKDKGEGLVNILILWWDNFFSDTRKLWRQLFSSEAKHAVTQQSPLLKTHPKSNIPTPVVLSNRFAPIAGLELIDQMRYPVAAAKNIDNSKGVKMQGSSSDFLNKVNGNVNIPLGQLSPGLYLVEGIIGEHRATTLLFVTDVVALTKNSNQQMMVWTADRVTGKAVADVKLSWTDGKGVLQNGGSDSMGMAIFSKSSPEHTYILGQDKSGGVFVSENYFYDSEIYNTKLYAFTDRPLYRPGDWVSVKMLGREFISSSVSNPIKASQASLEVIDPNGTVLIKQNVNINAKQGANTSFVLPDNAQAGGYDMRIQIEQDLYNASFRVAQYIKPHFDIHLVPAKSGFQTKEPIEAQLQLTYANGKPVVDANIEISVRAQQMSMVEGNLEYSGLFPLKIQSQTLRTDSKGLASLKLPAADNPSRYVVTALATDGAAYRVKMSKELLIERAASSYSLITDQQFSNPMQPLVFKLVPAKNQVVDHKVQAKTWQWIRLEDQTKSSGSLKGDQFELQLKQAGSYMISVRDENNNMLAATSHWVSGDGLKVMPGTIEIVLNKSQYQMGDTAQALITFPQAVDQALLTLERDKVENMAVLGGNKVDWLKTEKINAKQWRVDIPVQASHAPNMTFSVAYVANGTYAFQNAGLRVAQPAIEIAIKANKEVYAPGDMVSLQIKTSYQGKAISTALSLSVVDEMVYALQPEIAPSIQDFFYHPRRNNVRTSSSLNFISYDLSTSAVSKSPQRSEVNDRSVKLLERPRRDDVDTAAWMPQLSTDANGQLTVQFQMPDSLSRWRVTTRAMNDAGQVGQNTAWVKSDKSVYAKWTSDNWLRENDQANLSVVLFNQTSSNQAITWLASRVSSNANAQNIKQTELAKDNITIKPGANFIVIPVKANFLQANESIQIQLKSGNVVIDTLISRIDKTAAVLTTTQSQILVLQAGNNRVQLPSDASGIELQWVSQEQSGLYQALDDLITYPYGCTEQTASRLIPYSLALELGRAQMPSNLVQELEAGLLNSRIRLISMAGNNGYFGWWSDANNTNPFVTFYAYYADFRASQQLRIQLPANHGQPLLELYAKSVNDLTVVQRALVLSWLQEMGLPVKTQTEGLMLQLSSNAVLNKFEKDSLTINASLAFEAKNTPLSHAFASVLTHHIAIKAGLPWLQGLDYDASVTYLQNHAQNVMVKGVLFLVQRIPASITSNPANGTNEGDKKLAGLNAFISSLQSEQATLDRAMALVWISQSSSLVNRKIQASTETMAAPWRKKLSPTGQVIWQYASNTPLTSISKPDGLPSNAVAIVRYQTKASPEAKLPVKLSRNLYRVVAKGPYYLPEESGFISDSIDSSKKKNEIKNSFGRVQVQLELLKPGEVLRSDELYLDEIRLSSDKTIHYGIVEVPLPPGSHIEASTWGIYLTQGGALEAARFEQKKGAYVIPLDKFEKNGSGSYAIRHLLRLGQTGNYQLPAMRYWQMYQPTQQVWEMNSNWPSMVIQ
jgi:uncharacterized protein YfaS (alpha-2-macroglobulin family)